MTKFKVGNKVKIDTKNNFCGNTKVPRDYIGFVTKVYNEQTTVVDSFYVFTRALSLCDNSIKVNDIIMYNKSLNSIKYKVIFIDEIGALVEQLNGQAAGDRNWKPIGFLNSYKVIIPDRWIRITYKTNLKDSVETGSKFFETEEEARKGEKGSDNAYLAGVVKLENNNS